MSLFKESLFQKHQNTEKYPTSYSITSFTNGVLEILFPALSKSHKNYSSSKQLDADLNEKKNQLTKILLSVQNKLDRSAEELSEEFFNDLPEVYDLLQKDIDVLINGDPAAQSEFEVVRAYPGFYAIAFYRLAHALYNLDIPLLPRVLTEYAHSRTGIDIHPSADIASHFFIDHGTGIVIGETTKIGKYVKLYQGVTLGALSVRKDMARTKRHPTIEDNVVIYSNATILGGETVVGQDSIIGGNVWLTKSVPPNSRVYHKASIDIIDPEEKTI